MYFYIFGVKIHIHTIGKQKKANQKNNPGNDINKIRKTLTFLSLSKVHTFLADIKLGTGDAAQSALAAGSLRVVLCSFCSIFINNFKTGDVQINVLPEFDKECFEADLKSEFSIEALHVLIKIIKDKYKDFKSRRKNK